MKYRLFISLFFLKAIILSNDISFNGQFITVVNNVNKSSSIDFGYMPKTYYSYNLNEELVFDLEHVFFFQENYNSDIELKSNLYRSWIRFSNNILDLRIGLQKISFGSALFLRPLAWFDSLDFRYTTGQTDGVESMRFILSPSNSLAFWFWVVKNDISGSSYGGRMEVTTVGLLEGNWGFTYYRDTESNPHFPYPTIFNTIMPNQNIQSDIGFSQNNRFGLDYRYDGDFGFWLEGCYNDFDKYGNLTLLTFGADYTLPILNGLLVSSEAMFTRYSSERIAFGEQLMNLSRDDKYSVLHLSMPINHIHSFALYSISMISNASSFNNHLDTNITDNLLRWSSVYNSFSIDYMFTLKTGKLNDIFQIVFVYNY